MDDLNARVWAEVSAALEPKYQLVRSLGKGGMGFVFVAREEALERQVAVKVLTPALAGDPLFRQQFRKEGQAAAAISHANVVQVYTVGETHGSPPLPFMILQFVEGDSLDDWTKRQGLLGERRARRLLRDVASGLAAAHACDVVHLDVKPQNVLVERASGRAMILDFGLAAAVFARAAASPSETADGGPAHWGTPEYMSPEQLLGEPIGPPSDIFSFGLLAEEVLAGSSTSSAQAPLAMLAARFGPSKKPLSERRIGLSADLAMLVQRCLALDAERRPTAADLVRSLVPSFDEGVVWPPPGLSELRNLAHRMSRIAATTVIGVTLFSLAVAAEVPGTHTASGWWSAWGDGGLVVSAASGPSNTVVSLWHVALLSGLVTAVTGMLYSSRTIARLLSVLSDARALGWRASTLLDVMADADGRTGQTLDASGDFSALPPTKRKIVRRARAVQLLGPVAGLLWTGICGGLWTVSLVVHKPLAPAGGPLFGSTEIAVLLGPLLGCALAVLSHRTIEKRVIGSVPFRRLHTPAYPVPDTTRPADVTEWYRELGAEPRSEVRPGSAVAGQVRGQAVVLAFAVAVALVLSAALVSACAATVISARVARQMGADAARVAALHQRTGSPIPASGFLDLDYPRAASTPSQRALVRALLDDALAPFAVDPRLALGSSALTVSKKSLLADAMRRAHHFRDDSIVLLGQFDTHPRVLALRALAREPIDSLRIEARSLPFLRRALEANGAAAVFHVARRRLDSARQRLSENEAVASLILRGPSRIASETGLLSLETTALLPLAQLERELGREDRASAVDSAALIVADQRARYGADWSIGVLGLASDPRNIAEFEAIRTDQTIPIGYRSSLQDGLLDAFCLRPRYLLLGETDMPPNFVTSTAREERGNLGWWQRLQHCYVIGG